MNEQGYKAYFEGAKYGDSCNVEWIRGWIRAERESRCGWYDERGNPSEFNKDK